MDKKQLIAHDYGRNDSFRTDLNFELAAEMGTQKLKRFDILQVPPDETGGILLWMALSK